MTIRQIGVIAIGAAVILGPAGAAQQATFRSSVAAIVVPVSVTDRDRPVAGLTSADFQVRDNDVPQEITLTTVDRLPLDATLLIDTSGSVTDAALTQVKRDLQQMSDLLQPNDRVRVVTFGAAPADVFGVREGGARLPVESMQSGGTTSFYDALGLALAAFPYVDRPLLLFAVTDGHDTSSFTDADRIVELAAHSSSVLCVALLRPAGAAPRADGQFDKFDPKKEESSAIVQTLTSVPAAIAAGVSVPVVGATSIVSRTTGLFFGGPNMPALKAATGATGGLVFDDPVATAMPQVFRRVLDDFRASYVLSYSPNGVTSGGWHSITVKVKNPRYTVRARKGYDGKT